ncbi:hypothetical protein E4T44_08460 [Aureobasidium sp. EXF-8845]|nr:hypothetical protein E4T44_08460 [Aureobasidium sp. EXF-8845]KAI4843915.1 hypothetical protein E4T45_08381 [Aureobasidium sp. EXF-8846]
MESRQNAIVIPEVIFAILAGSLVLWRIINNVVLKRLFRLADLLIFLAMVSNLVALACSSLSTQYGLGRHIYDPFITPDKLQTCLRWIWIGEATNLISMLFAKLSIAAFLLYLDFASGYKIAMWITVAIVIMCNGAVALTSIFGSCNPVSLHWNMNQPGQCWKPEISKIATYVQSGSNIVTDILYTSVPIFYLSTVKLGANVQWGLRIVLLFGLIATVCSIVKIAVAGKMFNTHDPTWDAVDLSIWSTAEVNVCIIAACLPPLRSQFDSFLRRFFGMAFSRSTTRSRPTYGSQSIALQTQSKSHRTIIAVEAQDFGSERSILAPDDVEDGIIRKTRQVQVEYEEHGHDATYEVDHYTSRQ